MVLIEVKGGSPCAPREQVKSTTQREARGKIGRAPGVAEKTHGPEAKLA